MLESKAKQAIEIANHLSAQFKEKAPLFYYQLSTVITAPPVVYHVKSEAKKYTELAYEKLLSRVGKDDYRTLKIQFTLASVKTADRKFNQVIELYEGLISSVTSQMETSHPYELAARSSIDSVIRNGAATVYIAFQHSLPSWIKIDQSIEMLIDTHKEQMVSTIEKPNSFEQFQSIKSSKRV
jgi:hypothetical protein